jgi:hypothetical protein
MFMSLLTAWRDWKSDSPPFYLAGDEELASGSKSSALMANYSSWEAFTRDPDFGKSGDRRFHLGLVPVPFTGDLERAKVVLLLLNPGLEPGDYSGEMKVPGFRDRLADNLRQDFSTTEFPFVYLDPAVAWHPGYRWWHGKFQRVIADLAKLWHVSYADARRHFAKTMACVELVPYHSVSYSLSDRIRESLRSTRLAREYVRTVLRPRSEAGEVLIVVTRQDKAWGLAESKHVITYSGSERRAAHVTPRSRGGGKIVEFLTDLGPIDS